MGKADMADHMFVEIDLENRCTAFLQQLAKVGFPQACQPHFGSLFCKHTLQNVLATWLLRAVMLCFPRAVMLLTCTSTDMAVRPPFRETKKGVTERRQREGTLCNIGTLVCTRRLDMLGRHHSSLLVPSKEICFNDHSFHSCRCRSTPH